MWGRLLLGLTQAEQRGELRPDVHRFLADGYMRLARHQASRGRRPQATRLARKAAAHAEQAGGGDPPPACAMGLPRQRTSMAVEARGTVLPGRWPGTPSR
jgi:hypothetical protein